MQVSAHEPNGQIFSYRHNYFKVRNCQRKFPHINRTLTEDRVALK